MIKYCYVTKIYVDLKQRKKEKTVWFIEMVFCFGFPFIELFWFFIFHVFYVGLDLSELALSLSKISAHC